MFGGTELHRNSELRPNEIVAEPTVKSFQLPATDYASGFCTDRYADYARQ